MPEKEIPHAVWSGSFDVLGVEMKCHTLSDGRRVIEAESVEKFFHALSDGRTVMEGGNDGFDGFTKWRSGK